MNSRTTERFRKAYGELPPTVRRQAKAAYRLFKQNPNHPSLHFKRIHRTKPVYSVRVGRDYRALGALDENDLIWFWIGSHADYDKLLSQLSRS